MTVNSEVDICNLALDLLNQKPIQSIEIPNTSTEETMARWYDQTRREALRRHPWNFATTRDILAPSSTKPPFGWEMAFDLPSDYIRISFINESVIIYDNPVPYRLYKVENGQVLIGSIRDITAADQLRLVYIRDFKDVPQFDPLFIKYFYTLLAQNVAYKITQSNTSVERTNALMEEAESMARSMDGQESPPRRVERSRNRRARRTTGSVQNYDGLIAFE